MKFRKVSFFMILILVVTLFSGCWDKVEIEEQGYVAAIGIDKGSEKMMRITFQITNPKAGGGSGNTPQGGGGNSQPSDIITVEAPGLLTARELVSVSVTRRISLSHAKILVVGEDLAKTKEFFRALESSLRDKEIRRAMSLMISREKAEDFIRQNKPILEDRPEKFFQFMARRWRDTGLVPPNSNLNRFMQRTEEGGSLFLTTYGTAKNFSDKDGKNEADFLPGQVNKKGGNPTEIIGSAVFKEGRMIGSLTGDETRLVAILRPKPEVRSMVFTFPDPLNEKYRTVGRVIKQQKTKIHVDITEGAPVIDVTVPISIDILSIPSFESYPEDMNKQAILKNSIESYLEKESMKVVQKSQRDLNGDPFLWELAARKKFLTYDDYKGYDWMKKFPKAEITIHYKVNLKSFGKQLNPPEKQDIKQ
ncbi:Ger(x)C family spore germination protein [Clostridium sp. A1-XYC3]|uniref:Ger(X)C family spore germination protein n=1 Tax=Clostridium tanneri TaxID=3037988 RepID=A0ABU4JRR5_9CLOT|nr:Ger(x)C family spore germination protein [Clostridium sp. A1-XYC3]MDW8800842.1 Ger(x)C family spore germination protein [Clostridium sp. A1-XYC3]